MDDKIIDGRVLAAKREDRLLKKINSLKVKPKIVSILIGDDPPSLLYTQMKQKKARALGVEFEYLHFPKNESFEAIEAFIDDLNVENDVTGIMVQLPLPKQFLKGKKAENLLEKIDPIKDIDGLTGKGEFLPAAVKAVMTILEEEQIEVKGKMVAVLGTSRLVGLPLAVQMKKLGGEVTSVNKETKNVSEITSKADIIVSATGVANVLTGQMVKDGVIVIDVGTLVIEDELDETPGKKVVGDVDFESVAPKSSKITPVPGGVGPLTVISLMENAVDALV